MMYSLAAAALLGAVSVDGKVFFKVEKKWIVFLCWKIFFLFFFKLFPFLSHLPMSFGLLYKIKENFNDKAWESRWTVPTEWKDKVKNIFLQSEIKLGTIQKFNYIF